MPDLTPEVKVIKFHDQKSTTLLMEGIVGYREFLEEKMDGKDVEMTLFTFFGEIILRYTPTTQEKALEDLDEVKKLLGEEVKDV